MKKQDWRDNLAVVNKRLDEAGLMMHGDTIVDARLIAAPKSIKNQEGKSDPEMHQTKKGNGWHFGMRVMLVPMQAVDTYKR